MPDKGWKSITVRDEIYNYLWEKWQKNQSEYRLKHGITSFSGYVTRILYEALEKEKEEMKAIVREKS